MNKQNSTTKSTNDTQKLKTNASQSKSVTQIKPVAQSKPVSQAKPVASTKSTIQSKPVSKSKPAVQSTSTAQNKSVAPNKSTVQSKSAVSTKPAVQSKPINQPKNVAQSKPAAQSKPSTKDVPVSQIKSADINNTKNQAKSTNQGKTKNKKPTLKERTKLFFAKTKLKIKTWFANRDHRNDFIISVSYVLAITIFVSCTIGMMLRFFGPEKIKLVDPYNYTYARFDEDKYFYPETIDDSEWKGLKAEDITNGYATGTSKAPQTSTYLGTYDDVYVPEVKDESRYYGVERYPTWGSSMKPALSIDELDLLRAECHALAPSPTWKSKNLYDAIDSEGYLLKNGNRVKYPNSDEYRKLYKHTASAGMYGGNVSDDEPRIVKEITCTTRSKLAVTQITGLYAPPGELIKVEISEADMKAAGGSIRVYIGQNYNLDQHVSMENKGNGFNRLPDILSIFQINSNSTTASNATLKDGVYTAYVGSFIGGPIYFRANDSTNHAKTCNISVKFSGGVRYQHFILGVTTEEEYNANKTSSAPYFDLEIYEQSVRFTTSKYATAYKKALKDFSYEDCTDAAILWDKITEVSTRVAANGLSASSVPVVIIGDCYIAAGAAFANPGRNGVVCPPDWLAEALNYSHFVNGGCWGTMHEYNHCWQGYGVGNGGEVTNNATTLVAYSLYTRISAGRTSLYSWGNGSWNRFTDPSRALGELLNATKNGNKYYDLPLYATLLHNLGQDNFVAAARGGRESGSTNYYNNLVNVSHYDMTYYFTEVLHHNIGNSNAIGTLAKSAVDNVKSKNYPMFVPVSSVYQVGRSIIYDDEKYYIRTAQPFTYGSGEYVMDFNNHNNFAKGIGNNKNLVIPDGFTVSVVSVTQPKNGKVELLENNMVKYTPKNSSESLYSGDFRVKLRIIRNDRTFIVEDVDLIINLKQDNTIYRTTYIYEEGTELSTNSVYNSQTNTFDFGEFTQSEKIKNVCAQESSTEIWASGRNYYDATYNKDSKNYKVLPTGRTLQTLSGAISFPNSGTYRITLRGRGETSLYLSYNGGESWECALTINRTSGTDFINTEYTQHTFTTNNNYVLFKVVQLVKAEGNFFGIGYAAQNGDSSFSAFAYANADANSYIRKALDEESAKKFETEYHFKNQYTYSYSNTETYYATANTPISVNYDPWDSSQTIDKMFDGNGNTSYHSIKDQYITEEKPFELIVDLRSIRKVNTITFTMYHKNNGIGNLGMVKDFKLYGSTKVDGEYNLLLEKTDFTYSKKETISFSFEDVEIRYYKLVVTKTDNGRYFAMNRIVLSHVTSYPNGNIIAPNDFSVRYVGENVGNQKAWTTQNVFCNFGQIYVSQANGDKNYAELHFTGSRFAYFAYKSADYGTVDIYVDNKLVASNVSLNGTDNISTLAYIYTGDALSGGEHVVKIVGKSGKFNIDSFVVWE